MSNHSAIFSLLLPIGLLAGFFLYVVVRYTPVIVRIFLEKPVFLPLRITPQPGNEEVRFPTADGLELQGTYFHHRGESRTGVVLFCHEYLGDRWSALPYADHLRDLGFDLFAFDFRNHGESEVESGYEPLQWVSDREVIDLRAAIDYIRSRPDHDDAGLGLLGVSRGGSTAMVVAAQTPDVWGVVTDGAFPTHGTMVAYMIRWAEIYVGRWLMWRNMPRGVFSALAWIARVRAEIRLNTEYPSVERAASRIAPRPVLMIHGQRDAYIVPAIARSLFDIVQDPKEFWIVPRAKHNRCRELEPEAYAQNIQAFFEKWAPRRLPHPVRPESDAMFAAFGTETSIPVLAFPSAPGS